MWQVAASKDAGENGSSDAEARTATRLVSPLRRAFSSTAAIRIGDGSVAVTDPDGPTTRATSSAGMPEPHPTSRTVNPDATAASAMMAAVVSWRRTSS